MTSNAAYSRANDLAARMPERSSTCRRCHAGGGKYNVLSWTNRRLHEPIAPGRAPCGDRPYYLSGEMPAFPPETRRTSETGSSDHGRRRGSRKMANGLIVTEADDGAVWTVSAQGVPVSTTTCSRVAVTMAADQPTKAGKALHRGFWTSV